MLFGRNLRELPLFRQFLFGFFTSKLSATSTSNENFPTLIRA